MNSGTVLELFYEITSLSILLFQSYCQKHSMNQKRRVSEDSDDDTKGKRKTMTAEERSLARRQKYV